MKFSLLLSSLLLCLQALAQDTVFIEPTVTFIYDTELLLPLEVYSNSFHRTADHTFESSPKEDGSVFSLSIATENSPGFVSKKKMQKTIALALESFESDEETLFTELLKIDDFIGSVIITGPEKGSTKNSISFELLQYKDSILIMVEFFGETDLTSSYQEAECWQDIKSIISGITTYRKDDIRKSKADLKSFYQIRVDSLPTENVFLVRY